MDKESGFIRHVLLLFLAVFALTGCLGQEDEAAGAERALIVFFTHLSQGEYQAAAPPQTEFTFRVSRDGSGQYMVLDLPVYAP